MPDAPPHVDCGWRRPSMAPTSSRPSRLPPLSDNKERRRVHPRVPLLGMLRRRCSTSSLAWEENIHHGQLESGEEKPSPGQRKKSDLKKWTEESQLRVAGSFRGRGGRAGAGASSISWALAISWAWRQGGCRGRLYLLGTGDLAGRMPRCERQQSAMAIVQGGDGAVQCGEVAVQVGDGVSGRRLAPGRHSAKRLGRG